MPGGQLAIQIGEDFSILMTGPVTKVAEGTISEELAVAQLPAGA
jgi:diaminopimelate epimerase